MIPTASCGAVAISRTAVGRRLAAIIVVALLCHACAADAETTLARGARERQLGAAAARRDAHQRELARYGQECQELERAVAAAKMQSVRRASELRASLAELQYQVDRLTRAEQDLRAAKERSEAAERELQSLPPR